MRYLKLLSAVLVSAFLITSCASVAHVEKDDSVNIKNYHTYAWIDFKQSKNDSVKTKVSDLTERKIREAVNAELAKAGWKETKHNPDALISYELLVERGTRDRNDPVYSEPYTRFAYNPYSRRFIPIYYPSQFLGYDRDPRSVREGTITVSVIDGRSEKTVWQGWTTDEVNSKNLTNKEIQSAVKSIFRKFDVASR